MSSSKDKSLVTMSIFFVSKQVIFRMFSFTELKIITVRQRTVFIAEESSLKFYVSQFFTFAKNVVLPVIVKSTPGVRGKSCLSTLAYECKKVFVAP